MNPSEETITSRINTLKVLIIGMHQKIDLCLKEISFSEQNISKHKQLEEVHSFSLHQINKELNELETLLAEKERAKAFGSGVEAMLHAPY